MLSYPPHILHTYLFHTWCSQKGKCQNIIWNAYIFKCRITWHKTFGLGSDVGTCWRRPCWTSLLFPAEVSFSVANLNIFFIPHCIVGKTAYLKKNNRIVFSLYKERNFVICYNMGELEDIMISQIRQSQKQILWGSTYMRYLKWSDS